MYKNQSTNKLYILYKDEKVDILNPVAYVAKAPPATERNVDTFKRGACFNVEGHTFVKNCPELVPDMQISILQTRPWLIENRPLCSVRRANNIYGLS